MSKLGTRIETGVGIPTDESEGFPNDITATITEAMLKEVESELPLPISVQDYSDRTRLWKRVYVLNRSGCPVWILATTAAVDYKNEDVTDPTNYKIEIKERLDNKCFFIICVLDEILFEWSFVCPPSDQSPQYAPGLTIPNPNGQEVTFIKRSGTIFAELGQNRRSSPNSFEVSSTVSNVVFNIRITKKLQIFGSGGGAGDIRGEGAAQFLPITLETTITAGKTLRFGDETNLSIWASEFVEDLAVIQYGNRTNMIPTPNSASGSNRRSFRVETTPVYSFITQITPGSYVLVYEGANGLPKLKGYQTRTLDVIPANMYVTSGSSTRM